MNNVVYPVKRLSFINSNYAIIVALNPKGNFMYRKDHEEIINRLHEYFNLEGFSFPTAPVYRPAKTLQGTIDLLSPLDKNEFNDEDYPFVTVSDHDTIIGLIEKQIPILRKEEENI